VQDSACHVLKPNAVIVDLDGTLVDISSIRHHVEKPKPDFDQFHRLSVDCPPRPIALEILETYRRRGFKVLIVSARSEKYLSLTNMWLAINGIECDELLMRQVRDGRADIEVKTSMLARLRTKYSICAALDDRPELIENWKALQIPTVHDLS
jgi:acetolactate synthase regulatory subunit